METDEFVCAGANEINDGLRGEGGQTRWFNSIEAIDIEGFTVCGSGLNLLGF
jgi:hypothetical protein